MDELEKYLRILDEYGKSNIYLAPQTFFKLFGAYNGHVVYVDRHFRVNKSQAPHQISLSDGTEFCSGDSSIKIP